MDKIEDLYLSGVAAVKAGNRRLAQAFFKKVLRLDARHEGAWLWLSQSLDDPDDIAYCLESVLAINPQNEKARLALDLVRKRGEASGRPPQPREWSPLAELRELDLPAILAQTPPPSTPPPAPVPPGALLRPVPRPGPPEFLGRFAIFAGAIVIVLLLSIYLSLSPEEKPLPTRLPTPTPTVDVSILQEQERAAVRAYFYEVDALLGPLRLAHDLYRGQSSVRVSVAEQADRTMRLLAQVRLTRGNLRDLTPPEMLREAHQEYQQGLSLEEEALESLLRYLDTSQAGYANRAAVRFQEAAAHLDRAKAIWDTYREWAGIPQPTRLPTPTPLHTPTYGPSPTVTPTFPPRPTPTPTPFPTQPIGQNPSPRTRPPNHKDTKTPGS